MKTYNATEAGLEYFKDLQSDPEAWRGWEARINTTRLGWFSLKSHLHMLDCVKYDFSFRRKPKTVTVMRCNSDGSIADRVELPAPVREPLEDGHRAASLYIETGERRQHIEFNSTDDCNKWFEFFISQAQE